MLAATLSNTLPDTRSPDRKVSGRRRMIQTLSAFVPRLLKGNCRQAIKVKTCHSAWIKVTLWQKYDTRLPIFWRPVRQNQNLSITNIKSAVNKMSLHDPKRYRSSNGGITITLHAHQTIYAQQKNYATFALAALPPDFRDPYQFSTARGSAHK